jgi:hypothetical protein
MLDRQTDGITLQQASNIKDLVDILLGESADDKAAPRKTADKSLLFKFQEGFPNRGGAEADFLEEAADGDPFPRREFSCENGFFDRKIDFISEDGSWEGFEFSKDAWHLIYQVSSIKYQISTFVKGFFVYQRRSLFLSERTIELHCLSR